MAKWLLQEVRSQAKIGVPPNSWRIRFAPLGETSYFAIFSAAARWKAYIIDEPIISTRSSLQRPILYGRSICLKIARARARDSRAAYLFGSSPRYRQSS